MANELTLTGLFSYIKGNRKVSPTGKTSATVSVSGTNTMDHTQSIGTSEEAIVLGDVVPGGYCYFENLDSTNFVSIRQQTGVNDLIRIKAGEFAIFRMDADATAPFAIADTSSVDLMCILLED